MNGEVESEHSPRASRDATLARLTVNRVSGRGGEEFARSVATPKRCRFEPAHKGVPMKRLLLRRGVRPGALKLPAGSENRGVRMTRAKRYASGFLSVLAILLAIGVSAAWAADRYVATTGNDTANNCSNSLFPCQTIQKAINEASPSDTIHVAAGIYPEPPAGSPLTVNKTLTLLGAQNGVDARGRVATESIVTDSQGTYVTASNVVIDGFTFENSTNPAFTNYGILMGAGTTGTQLLNNIIQNNIVGIGLANSGGSQVLIRHNQIQNNNVFFNVCCAGGTGIYTDEFVSGGAVKNVLIEENAFIGNDDAGIDVSNTALPGVSGLDVSTNSFDMNGRGVVLFNTHMSTIHDNSITNSTFVGSAAIRLFDNNSNLSIMNNDLTTGAGRAIRLSFLGLVGGPSSGVVINENNIGTVGFTNFVGEGLLVEPGSHVGTVNAECNWWGSPSGPFNATNNPTGTGEEVVGDADFTPWLAAPAPGGACIGGVPSGKVTGGGQVRVNMTGGKGTFGFNAKSDSGVGSGHLNYLNHVTGAHLDCKVTFVTELTPTTAKFEGTCSPNSAAMSFMAEVEDNAKQGKNADKFKITYGTNVDEGGPGPIISGNIEIK